MGTLRDAVKGRRGEGAATSVSKWRWPRRIAIIVGLLVALFYAGGGWYFSGQIRSGGLEPRAPERDFDVVVERIESETVVLSGGDEAIDDPGQYALYWEDGFGLVDDVVSITPTGVRRPFVLASGLAPPLAPQVVDLDAWYYPTDPADAGLAFEEVIYGSPVGDMKAWYVPSPDGPAETWAIHAHGWRVDRREALRTLPTFHSAGIDSLVVEYRNDPDAPPDPTGRYRFGRSEWQDIEGAVRYALDHGASRVVLVGYSTGAASEMAFLERSDLAGAAVGVVFDSPNLDFGRVVKTQARDTALIPGLPFTVPDSLTATAMFIADLRYDVGWADIDYVDHDYRLTIPALVFHGDADGTVPLSVSEDFADTHPGVIQLVVTPGADHVRSWNADRECYERMLGQFLSALSSEGVDQP